MNSDEAKKADAAAAPDPGSPERADAQKLVDTAKQFVGARSFHTFQPEGFFQAIFTADVRDILLAAYKTYLNSHLQVENTTRLQTFHQSVNAQLKASAWAAIFILRNFIHGELLNGRSPDFTSKLRAVFQPDDAVRMNDTEQPVAQDDAPSDDFLSFLSQQLGDMLKAKFPSDVDLDAKRKLLHTALYLSESELRRFFDAHSGEHETTMTSLSDMQGWCPTRESSLSRGRFYETTEEAKLRVQQEMREEFYAKSAITEGQQAGNTHSAVASRPIPPEPPESLLYDNGKLDVIKRHELIIQSWLAFIPYLEPNDDMTITLPQHSKDGILQEVIYTISSHLLLGTEEAEAENRYRAYCLTPSAESDAKRYLLFKGTVPPLLRGLEGSELTVLEDFRGDQVGNSIVLAATKNQSLCNWMKGQPEKSIVITGHSLGARVAISTRDALTVDTEIAPKISHVVAFHPPGRFPKELIDRNILIMGAGLSAAASLVVALSTVAAGLMIGFAVVAPVFLIAAVLFVAFIACTAFAVQKNSKYKQFKVQAKAANAQDEIVLTKQDLVSGVGIFGASAREFSNPDASGLDKAQTAHTTSKLNSVSASLPGKKFVNNESFSRQLSTTFGAVLRPLLAAILGSFFNSRRRKEAADKERIGEEESQPAAAVIQSFISS